MMLLYITEYSQEVVKYNKNTQKPHSLWTSKERKYLRNFFENYARKRNLDPLVPETWYFLSGHMIKSADKVGLIAWRFLKEILILIII